MPIGYLGIDAGTQGLSVIFTDESLNVLSTGEGSYDMVPGLDEGCYEQVPDDWTKALVAAMNACRSNLDGEMKVLAHRDFRPDAWRSACRREWQLAWSGSTLVRCSQRD